MRRVCRDWAQRARDSVAQRHAEAALDARCEQAMNAWRPPGLPIDLLTSVPLAEAIRRFKEGAEVMKRKGAVTKIDVDDRWLSFGGLKDQHRYLVGHMDDPSQFVLYYAQKSDAANGIPPRGWFSLEELKLAQYSYRLKEIGVYSDMKKDGPIMKKISKIPPDFFAALVVCVRSAIGTQIRKSPSASFLTKRSGRLGASSKSLT